MSPGSVTSTELVKFLELFRRVYTCNIDQKSVLAGAILDRILSQDFLKL